jgi:hypothetical protein
VKGEEPKDLRIGWRWGRFGKEWANASPAGQVLYLNGPIKGFSCESNIVTA